MHGIPKRSISLKLVAHAKRFASGREVGCRLSNSKGTRIPYAEAILAVYVLNRTVLLRDHFIMENKLTASGYAAARQSIGETV